MTVQNVLDVVGENIFAATDHHVLLAIDDVEVTFFVKAVHLPEREETRQNREPLPSLPGF